MRRTLSFLLALVMLVCGFAGNASATMIGGGATLVYGDVGGDDPVTAVTAVQDTLYLLHQNGQVTTRPVDKNEEIVLGEVLNTQGYLDEPPATQEGQARMDRLFTWQGEPYGLCSAAGEVWRLLDESGAFAPATVENLTLDVSSLIRKNENAGYYSTAELNSFFCQDDWLYYTGLLYGEGTPEAMAGRISLATGQKQDFSCPKLSAFTPGENGQILALLYDRMAMYGSGSVEDIRTPAQYGVFDPEKDAVDAPADIPTENEMAATPSAAYATATEPCTTATARA